MCCRYCDGVARHRVGRRRRTGRRQWSCGGRSERSGPGESGPTGGARASNGSGSYGEGASSAGGVGANGARDGGSVGGGRNGSAEARVPRAGDTDRSGAWPADPWATGVWSAESTPDPARDGASEAPTPAIRAHRPAASPEAGSRVLPGGGGEIDGGSAAAPPAAAAPVAVTPVAERMTAAPDPAVVSALADPEAWLASALADLDRIWGKSPAGDGGDAGPPADVPETGAGECVVVLDLAREGQRLPADESAPTVRRVARRLAQRLPESGRLRRETPDAVSVVLADGDRAAAAEWMRRVVPALVDGLAVDAAVQGALLRAAVHDEHGVVGAQVLQRLDGRARSAGPSGRSRHASPRSDVDIAPDPDPLGLSGHRSGRDAGESDPGEGPGRRARAEADRRRGANGVGAEAAGDRHRAAEQIGSTLGEASLPVSGTGEARQEQDRDVPPAHRTGSSGPSVDDAGLPGSRGYDPSLDDERDVREGRAVDPGPHSARSRRGGADRADGHARTGGADENGGADRNAGADGNRSGGADRNGGAGRHGDADDKPGPAGAAERADGTAGPTDVAADEAGGRGRRGPAGGAARPDPAAAGQQDPDGSQGPGERRPYLPDGVVVRPGTGGRRHRRGDEPAPAEQNERTEADAATSAAVEPSAESTGSAGSAGAAGATEALRPGRGTTSTGPTSTDGLGLADLLAGALAAYRGI